MNAIVEKHLKSKMTDVILELDYLVKEWTSTGAVPEVDWSRMRSLDFQETVRARDRLLSRNQNPACVLCADFDHHVRVVVPCSLSEPRLVRAVLTNEMDSTLFFTQRRCCGQTSRT